MSVQYLGKKNTSCYSEVVDTGHVGEFFIDYQWVNLSTVKKYFETFSLFRWN